MSKNLRHILHIIITTLTIALLVVSCALFKEVPVKDQINIRDSIAIHQVDSIVYIPKEVIKDIVPVYDTLKMNTSMAEAEAYVDTITHTLKGSLKNKQGTTTKIKYIDRVHYRDSIQIKEVPIPVEIEKEVKIHPWYERILWIMSAIGLIFIGLISLKIYRKIVFHV